MHWYFRHTPTVFVDKPWCLISETPWYMAVFVYCSCSLLSEYDTAQRSQSMFASWQLNDCAATVWGLNGCKQNHGLCTQSVSLFIFCCEWSHSWTKFAQIHFKMTSPIKSTKAFVICSDSEQPEWSPMAQNGSHSGSWELNYIDRWAKYVNSFRRIED